MQASNYAEHTNQNVFAVENSNNPTAEWYESDEHDAFLDMLITFYNTKLIFMSGLPLLYALAYSQYEFVIPALLLHTLIWEASVFQAQNFTNMAVLLIFASVAVKKDERLLDYRLALLILLFFVATIVVLEFLIMYVRYKKLFVWGPAQVVCALVSYISLVYYLAIGNNSIVADL